MKLVSVSNVNSQQPTATQIRDWCTCLKTQIELELEDKEQD